MALKTISFADRSPVSEIGWLVLVFTPVKVTAVPSMRPSLMTSGAPFTVPVTEVPFVLSSIVN
jgi:hypothetical protein